MYVCMCIFVYLYMHIYTYVYIYTHTHIYVYTCKYPYLYLYTYTYICMNICLYTCMCVYTLLYTPIYIHMCMYTHYVKQTPSSSREHHNCAAPTPKQAPGPAPSWPRAVPRPPAGLGLQALGKSNLYGIRVRNHKNHTHFKPARPGAKLLQALGARGCCPGTVIEPNTNPSHTLLTRSRG